MKNLFLTNYTDQTFLDRIRDNLRKCDSFAFSVSFIKKAGLSLLVKDIESALARGASGRFITSTYQNFTDIESLKIFFLLQEQYPKFQCHLDFESFHDDGYMTIGYHSKGYYFEFGNEAELIVGSSNITRHALLKNVEWDLVVHDSKSNVVFEQMWIEFKDKWLNTFELDNEIISKYINKLNYAIERWDMDYDGLAENVSPNYMQRKAMKELNRYRTMGLRKALVVAAAGSGKTYLAAFDARNFNPKRLLYIVHEGSILQKALETFREVFTNDVTYGVYNKDCKDIEADFVFAGNIILSQNLNLFKPEDFDYIILDECHHATAESYRRIIEYFKPEFMLGLTATPERMDNEDVFELFDTNVPFELRLRDAIINDLVVPFHYYGIRDSLVDYGLNTTQERKLISQLASVDHCAYIKEKIEEYRPQGKLKALAFCRNITHASMMAEALQEQGYATAYLTGKNTIGERIRAYNDLQKDETGIEILCTVDILNEGVDIPGCNMVLFLRPTESATVFIQQLGRGLRKYDNKPYVTVLDFIGNSYKRSVQIAFAMGSLAENFVIEKRLMKSLVKDDFSALGLEQYGVKIHFDDESQSEIIQYIDQENFNSKYYMEKDYYNFKQYINAEFYPKHMDYLNNDCAPDLMRFMQIKINGRKTGCYYSFLQGIEESNLPVFDDAQVAFIKYASSLLPLVRKHEYLVLHKLLDEPCNKDELTDYLLKEIEKSNLDEVNHTFKIMEKKGAIKNIDDIIHINVRIDDQFKEYMLDLLKYGIAQYEETYRNSEKFILWHDYRKDQVQLKLLKDPDANARGTYYYGDEVVIFASLKKDATLEERLKYKDKFLEPSLFQWESVNSITDKELQALRLCKYVHLFVRKVEKEHGIQLPFTYVGEGRITNERAQSENGTYLFDIPMEAALPEYLQYDFGVAQ